MTDQVSLEFSSTFTVELFKELLAAFRKLDLLFMLEELVQDLENGLERIITQLHVISPNLQLHPMTNPALREHKVCPLRLQHLHHVACIGVQKDPSVAGMTDRSIASVQKQMVLPSLRLSTGLG